MEPSKTEFDLEKAMSLLKQAFGHETIAYWQFFNSQDASATIEKNVSIK
jgi:hypothetical protein